MAKKYRVGNQDKRERYSDRVQLLIFDNDRLLNPEYKFLGDTLYCIFEFDALGDVIGRDVLDDYSEAKHEFDALVEMVEYQDDCIVRPI